MGRTIEGLSTIAKAGYSAALKVPDPGIAEGFGSWFKSAAIGKLDPRSTWNTSDKGDLDLDTKAAVGTPLRGDATTGSYLIPTQYVAEILRIAAAQSDLMGRVRRIAMTSRTAHIPVSAGGVTFTVPANETADLTESSPTFDELTLSALTYAAWMGVSEECLEDSISNLGSFLQTLFAEALVTTFETGLLTASTPTVGLLKDPLANVARMSTGKITFEALQITDLKNLVSALTTKAKRRGACFIMSPEVLDVVMSMRDAEGLPIFRDSPTNGAPARTLGYEYIVSDSMPGLSDSAANTAFIAFGRPDCLLFGDRVQLELRFYDSTIYNVQNAQCFFRARCRMGLDVGIPTAFSILKTATS